MRTLSVQLYSVRDQLAADQNSTLTSLAGLGFRYVEPFGLGGSDRSTTERVESARRLRAGLDAAGLTAPTVHAGIPNDLGELAEECAILGVDTVFVPHPRLVPGFDAEDFADVDRVDAFADTMSSLAQDCASHGLRLGYHNHWFEWAALPGGETGYDRFWSRVSDTVLAEVDLYWAAAGGADPTEVLSALAGRVVSVHVKDGPATPGEPQTPLGTGLVDMRAPLTAAEPVRWHVVEIDTTELDAYELLGTNAEYLVSGGLSVWS